MDDKELITMLPLDAKEEMVDAIIRENPHEFGGELLIYHRVSVEVETVALQKLMTPADIERYLKGKKRVWAAECHCAICGSIWMSAWMKGGSIGIIQGEDGANYPGLDDGGGSFGVMLDYEEGDAVNCPFCERVLKVMRRSRIKHSRTNQLMACEITNLGKYTTLLYYLVYRRIGADGVEDEGAKPIYATVIGEDGELVRYCRSVQGYNGKQDAGGPWRRYKMNRNPETIRYHSADGVNQTKVGAALVWRRLEAQADVTGEKTGLYEYIAQGGEHAEEYLRFWRRNPTVENLVKAGGWVNILSDAIDNDWDIMVRNSGLRYGNPDALADWGRAKPHEMLYMEKAEFRRVSGKWSRAMLEFWMNLVRCGCAAQGGVSIVEEYVDRYGLDDVRMFMDDAVDGEVDFDIGTVDRYLRRQNRKHGIPLCGKLGIWRDYINMVSHEGVIELEARQIWPENLMVEHDAAMKKKTRAVSKAAFNAVYKRWKALEWSDGEICIKLPRCNQDLVDEGRTLHHCVGGYGEEHVNEKIVLFVRHARRPERSWYTLNIDVRGASWHRIQLHGYRNECIGEKGLCLTIDKRALAFCDRWEREVLTPVFREVVARDAKSKSKKSKSKKGKEKAA